MYLKGFEYRIKNEYGFDKLIIIAFNKDQANTTLKNLVNKFELWELVRTFKIKFENNMEIYF